MENVNIPDSCSDDQFAGIVKNFQKSTVLPENLKAFYIDQLQKKYAAILLKRTITASMSAKAAAIEGLESDDDITITLTDKRRRTK